MTSVSYRYSSATPPCLYQTPWKPAIRGYCRVAEVISAMRAAIQARSRFHPAIVRKKAGHALDDRLGAPQGIQRRSFSPAAFAARRRACRRKRRCRAARPALLGSISAACSMAANPLRKDMSSAASRQSFCASCTSPILLSVIDMSRNQPGLLGEAAVSALDHRKTCLVRGERGGEIVLRFCACRRACCRPATDRVANRHWPDRTSPTAR